MPSPALRLVGATLSFDDAPLFEDVTHPFAAGWTGLIGPNGHGKTSLLRVLAGAQALTRGRVDGADGAGLLLEQRLETPPPDLNDFASAYTDGAAKLRAQLRLEPEQAARWDTLSWGERQRWRLGVVLWQRPPVLLLDEPTNHLDAAGRVLVARALRDARVHGLVVSHDRAFLDALTTATVRLAHGAFAALPLACSDALAEWDRQDAAAQARRSDAQDRLARATASLHDVNRRAAASSAQRSAGARMKSKHDRDARSMSANFATARAEQSLRQAQRQAQGHHARAREALDALAPPTRGVGSLSLRAEPLPRPRLVALPASVTQDTRVPLTTPSLTVERGAKLLVEGDNGAGKSTLLECLYTRAQLPPERCVYLPQELSLDDARADQRRVADLSDEDRGSVQAVLARLGVDVARWARSAAPSPGEARKVRLALALGLPTWAAFLDEPTNHLDLPTVRRLEEALRAYAGTLVLVTHDAALARSVASLRWQVSGGRVRPATADFGWADATFSP